MNETLAKHTHTHTQTLFAHVCACVSLCLPPSHQLLQRAGCLCSALLHVERGGEDHLRNGDIGCKKKLRKEGTNKQHKSVETQANLHSSSLELLCCTMC